MKEEIYKSHLGLKQKSLMHSTEKTHHGLQQLHMGTPTADNSNTTQASADPNLSSQY